MPHPLSARAMCTAALLAASLAVPAHDPASRADPAAPAGDVALHDDLGSLSYAIQTREPLAQRYFDQGLRLTWAFNHAEALRSFRAAAARDPSCAMCRWGQAFVLGPNINAGMESESNHPALDAVEEARKLARDPREKALADALARRYSGEANADQAVLNQAYADAMREVARAYPGDTEIGVLYVDAVMNTRPWDYWEADGLTPKGEIDDAIHKIEQVLAANPDHPGAIHLYIHLTEASKNPQRAEPYADKLAALMPGAGHLVHMPSHVYYRVGRYRDSARINIEAARVDERSLERMAALDIYRYGYYPHNLHFVITSAQMAGDGETALAYAQRLGGKIRDDVALSVGWVQIILAAPYFAHAQFSPPETILAVPEPHEQFPYVRAMWHYARGIAHAAGGSLDAARAERAAIEQIAAQADFSMLLQWAVPAPDLLQIAGDVVDARIAQAGGDSNRAIALLDRAVAIQDRLPYLEPPFWYYPVRQTLGAALLAAGHPALATEVVEESLRRYPNNVYALEVLRKAQSALGDKRADATARRIRQASIGELAVFDLRRI